MRIIGLLWSAIAALNATGTTTIHGAEAAAIFYPDFTYHPQGGMGKLNERWSLVQIEKPHPWHR